MKITRKYLLRIIKEEVEAVIAETQQGRETFKKHACTKEEACDDLRYAKPCSIAWEAKWAKLAERSMIEVEHAANTRGHPLADLFNKDNPELNWDPGHAADYIAGILEEGDIRWPYSIEVRDHIVQGQAACCCAAFRAVDDLKRTLAPTLQALVPRSPEKR